MDFTYIIIADGLMAHPFKSDLDYFEFIDYVREKSTKLHPKGRDTCFRWGVIEFINPKVMSVNDFANFMPGIL